MAKPKEDQDRGKLVVLSVTRPPDSAGPPMTSEVKTMMGNTGTLCNAFGTATFPGNPFRIDGYYFKVKQESTPSLTPNDVKNNYQKYLPCPSGTTPWDYSAGSSAGQLPATGGNADNVMYVVRSYCDVPMHPVVEFETNPANLIFKGTSVSSCTPLPSALKASASAAAPNLHSVHERGPAGSHGDHSHSDWLLYPNMSAANFGPGNILTRHGQPLRARVLNVAACNVNWQHGWPQTQTTWRSFGDGLPGNEDYRFKWAPQNSIVMWQKSAADDPRGTVIGSESREHPSTVYVDPNEEIRVQVNFALAEEFSRSGGFDLWVKVVY